MVRHQPIIITGATATGKTSLAYLLAQQFQIQDIIACDSRQIYKYMDIVTGKDIPQDFQFHPVTEFQVYQVGYFQGQINHHTVRLWGFNLALPDQQFSVSNYVEIFNTVIFPLISNTFIVVGGTGFYLDGLFNPKSTFSIPPDFHLRDQLSKLSILELKKLLENIDAPKYNSMNNSDQNNPRRLIRAIEVASSKSSEINKDISINFENPIWIGLKHLSLDQMDQSILTRVQDRVNNQNLSSEIELLIQNDWQLHAPSHTLGYPQLFKYFTNQIDKSSLLSSWLTSEKQYARRQLTWFNKQTHIKWFQVGNNDQVKEFIKQML